ncbi:30S ribosomal protein S9 [Microbacterium sp. 2FI]|uniref:30S ribosomal protein S9 n=1 Tax=Microbacterium sp. 2FI TaxID=2502193 RepID=UPI0010F776A4|nr:30S ribosomal protein S9 [Microbacterium sp. 2FI]
MANIEEDTSNYSTETPVDQTVAAVERPVLTVPGAAVGRRKQAIARVRIVPGSGTITVNGRTFEDYFPNKLHQQLVKDPFTVLNLTDAYDVIARISGGGPSGQAGALRLGIARSLNGIDEENNRPTLKKAGFLSRDARVKERKKAGLKKARKAPQYSKR